MVWVEGRMRFAGYNVFSLAKQKENALKEITITMVGQHS